MLVEKIKELGKELSEESREEGVLFSNSFKLF